MIFFSRNACKNEIILIFAESNDNNEANHAEVAQLVEHNLAKVRVASSSLVFRSQVENLAKQAGFFTSEGFARVVESVDTKDLKSFDHCDRAGSSPAPGTTKKPTSDKQRLVFWDQSEKLGGDLSIDIF